MSPSSAAKERGNAAFKAGDYPSAIGHYTTAILADPSDPTFPLNRAAAYLKLGKNEDAERDCTKVLALAKTNVKALFRRGQARAAFLKHADAIHDLQQALKLEPQNDAVKVELQKVKAAFEKSKEKGKGKALPVDIPPPPPSTAPPKHRRIPITIVEPESSPPTVLSPSPRTPDSPLSRPTSDDLLTPVSSRPLSPVSPALGPTKPSTFKAAKEAREAARPGGGIFRASGTHTVFDTKARSSSPLVEKSAPAKDSPMPEMATATHPLPAPAAEGTPPPMTLFEFTRAWDALASSPPAARWALLSQTLPSALPRLFQNSLDPSLLTSILQTFRAVLAAHDTDTPELRGWVRAYLEALRRVSRCVTVVMLMSKAEKVLGKEIAEMVGAEGGFW
ncbi:hypothetical protein EVG20_g5375 [Dentipellis fragilis]|uniref:RNA polymerase II-associated protein 3 n=1 Tax=Dentipellis fragilis TaxID=205917 RepID=A0A4Y9YTG6_9AGAM|nr:hypothetical protein EVG20_g5375 [Dentipellis fragilis]